MGKYKVGVISLGCDKNRIDSEIMLGTINSNYVITNDASEADILIINTNRHNQNDFRQLLQGRVYSIDWIRPALFFKAIFHHQTKGLPTF